nr:CpcH2=C-phycocyanin-associated rod-linker polypeptide [Calothrix sp., PCC 7601, phycobilisomes, Peptide Partial, 7 aa] [Calothrix]
TSSTAAR